MNTFRAIREKLGLTQEEIGQIINKTQGNVAHYERGQTVPPEVAGVLIKYADEHGHSLTYDDFYDQEKKRTKRRAEDKKH